MTKKTTKPTRAPRPATSPSTTPTSREITISATHLVTAVAVVVAVGLILGLLGWYFGSRQETASTAPVMALPPNAAPGQGQPGSASAPIQIQPGGQPIQVAPGGQPVQIPQGQVVMPSGANRPDSTPEGFPLAGRADAPVTILEFSDFQCPYCREFAQEVLPKIAEKYIIPGKARLIWRDAAIRGPESEAAAAAALCAHEHGRFWAYHDALYSRQQGQNEGAFTPANLKAIAAQAGRIQLELFNQCVDSGRYLPAVKASTQDAQTNVQVAGTPTFIIGGQKLEGNIGWEKWDELLTVATQGK